MKKRFIKRIGLFAAFLMMFSCFFGFDGLVIQAKAEDNLIDNREQIVRDYFDCVDRGDWEQWVLHYVPAVRNEYIRLISDEQNWLDNRGILTVNTVEILDIVRADNTVVPRVYPELEPFFESEETYACYYVRISTTVNEDNGYFSNGVSARYIVMVCENGQWGVGAMCGAPDFQAVEGPVQASLESTPTVELLAIKKGFVPFSAPPTTFVARDNKGDVYTVEFKPFIINVVCNEIGNLGYCADALKANVIAAKMYSWWMINGDYFGDIGYDIRYGMVTFKSTLETNETNTQIVTNAVNAVWNYCMVSSESTGGQLFPSAYYGLDSRSMDGKSAGRLRQNSSDYLGDLGYSWKQILHYYYDNSNWNNDESVGVVQILCLGTHTYGTTYEYNNLYHWHTCNNCEYKLKETHTYTYYGTYQKCNICGNTIQIAR